jgi:uncharacterized protein YjiS (DUF1127 family)
MRAFVDYESLWADLHKQTLFLAAGAATGRSQLLADRQPADADRAAQTTSAVLHRVRAMAVRLGRRIGVGVARLVRSIEQSRRARANYEVLSRLDAETLRDLGLTHSEIGSAAAELGGRAAVTRRRIEADFWRAASAGFRVRRVEIFLGLAVFAAFSGVVAVALKSPEILAAWRATVVFV